MAIIEFINNENRTYPGMKRALGYIVQQKKTLQHLIGGMNCNPDTAYYEYVLTKQKFIKEKGRLFIHFTQSFSPMDVVTPEMAFEIAAKLLEHECFKGFQIKYASHIDREHIHTHFIINSVNAEDGHKWQQSPKSLESLKAYSDELCREYGLMVVDGEKGKHKDRGAYRSEQKGRSWRKEIYLAVKHCKWCSSSKEDFIANMNQLGFKVDWQDSHKYITFMNSEGKKLRNKKLYPPEQFTKEVLLQQFELNQQREDAKQLRNHMELLLTVIKNLGKDTSSMQNKHYPLQRLEGQGLIDEIRELKKGKGFEWDREL